MNGKQEERTKTKEQLLEEIKQLQEQKTGLDASIEQLGTERDSLKQEIDFAMKMINFSPTYFFTASADCITLLMNDTMAQALGYRPSEVVGKDFIKYFVHPGEQLHVLEHWVKLKENKEKIIFETTLVNKDKSDRKVEIHCSTILSSKNEIDVIFGVGIDLSARIETQKIVHESEEKFYQLAENSPNMIFINRNGRIIYANKKCEGIMGYSRTELYDENFDFRTLIDPEYLTVINQSFQKHMNGEYVAPYAYKIVTKNGQILEAIITTHLVNSESGYTILGIVTDITDYKKIENELRSS